MFQQLTENRDIEFRQIAMVTDIETGSLPFRFNELVYHYCEYDSRNNNVDLVIISWLSLIMNWFLVIWSLLLKIRKPFFVIISWLLVRGTWFIGIASGLPQKRVSCLLMILSSFLVINVVFLKR